MIKITEAMREPGRNLIKEYEAVTDKRIISAVEKGLNKAVFPLDDYDELFSELKELYERNGYKIVPVGMIGGVVQRDYYIMW